MSGPLVQEMIFGVVFLLNMGIELSFTTAVSIQDRGLWMKPS